MSELDAFAEWKLQQRRKGAGVRVEPRQRRTRLVILGLGFAGMEALRQVEQMGDAARSSWEVVVVERRDYWLGGLANQYLMTGRKDEESCRSYYRNLRFWTVARWVRDEVTGVDVDRREVQLLASGALAYDRLVVALGTQAQPAPFIRGPFLCMCDPDAMRLARAQIEALASGTVLVMVCRMPYKCPPAPFEIAFLVDAMLRQRGVRDRCRVVLAVPLPTAVPVECPQAILALLREKNIDFWPGVQPRGLDAAADGRRQTVQWMAHPKFNPNFSMHPDPGALTADVVIGMWPQAAPAALRSLCDESGHIPTDVGTLRTRHRDVYCVGDCAGMELPTSPPKPHPKAGGFAEGQARVAIRNVLEGVWDEEAPHRQDESCAAVCAVETSLDDQLLLSIDLHSHPGQPVIQTQTAPPEFKEQWWEEHARRWFH